MSRVVSRDSLTGRNRGHDLTNRRFGKLVILKPTGERCPNNYRLWEAQCDCGNVVVRPSYRFIRDHPPLKSCGCGPVGRKPIPNSGAHINAIHSHYRRNAHARGIGFYLTKKEVHALVVRNCTYCGNPPVVKMTHNNLAGEFAWTGIDRLDSSLDYTTSNCVPCCPRCNRSKNDMRLDDFKEWIRRVHRHLGL